MVAVVVLVTGRSVTAAVRVLVELLMAAGLLGLSFGMSWAQIATAAVVVAVRKLVVSAIGAAETARTGHSGS
ncbi:hypothetical protein [Actinokineospora sp. UTMC 2448]|uniref:hypothetical protein n=1 Tax=Actinokineospora sp. UTMC 2448 TaxID=2268449 RepID=UPI0021648382|nr:hypothetical protein [Actinokineospora sp. UTMC 2448]